MNVNHGHGYRVKSDVRGFVPLKDEKIKMKTSDQDECVLCCREISIYAVGICDHPVCYICSARMRVLCETNECPICRSDMPMVICTWKKKPFLEISKKFSLIDKKFQITFENSEIQESFLLLLENKCPKCDSIFPTFNKLRDHVRREHSLQYCELCAENLKLFPFERKIYDRKDLARHKRIGDPDETSHRGHPLCEFCDQRYVDSDELFRHLRREHYFCHFCDADGKNQFYEDYSYLRVHFRKDHYLCEEGDCANEQFTGAFRTEIDLKAHIATHHSKNKSKAEARQARMLELEFTYAPHNRSNVNSSPRGHRFNHKRQNAEGNNSRSDNRENKSSQQVETEKIDTQSTLEFPYLSEDGESNNVIPKGNLNSMTLQSFNRNTVLQRPKETMSFDDFPALVSTTVSVTSEVTNRNNQSRKINFSIHSQNNMPGKAPNVSIHLAQKNMPSKTESDYKEIDSKKQTPTWISKKSTNFEDEFPKLETKKPPVTYSNFVNTTVVNNVQSISQSNVEIVSSSQTGGDQFLYIKSKSRKKKNKIGHEDKTSESVDDTDEKNRYATLFVNNNNSTLPEQDPDEKIKKNLLRPSPKANFVEEDTWQRKVTFGKDDFPPLAPSEPIRKPPGFGNKSKKPPPPGFNFSSNSCGNSAPLNISLSSIARQLVSPNENKNVGSVVPHSDFKYKQPLNFHKRNEDLKNKIMNLSVFDEFRTKSGEFRKNEITAATYYSECLKMLGKNDFMDIFPELICLLPDINKQQELFDVHKKHQNNYGAVPKQKLENNKITICDICYQVLMEFDYGNHVSQHEKEN